MDKLFDMFNSSKAPGLKDFKRPIKNTTSQINHLDKMIDLFKNLKVIDKFKGSNVIKCIHFIKG